MTPQHYKSIREAELLNGKGGSQAEFGIWLGYSEKSAQRNVSRHERGENIPLYIDKLLRYLEKYGDIDEG